LQRHRALDHFRKRAPLREIRSFQHDQDHSVTPDPGRVRSPNTGDGKVPPHRPKNKEVRSRDYLTENKRENLHPCLKAGFITGLEQARVPVSEIQQPAGHTRHSLALGGYLWEAMDMKRLRADVNAATFGKRVAGTIDTIDSRRHGTLAVDLLPTDARNNTDPSH